MSKAILGQVSDELPEFGFLLYPQKYIRVLPAGKENQRYRPCDCPVWNC